MAAPLTFRASGWVFLALAAAAVPAFWPRYLAVPSGAVDDYTHAHALVMALWTALLVAQPFLSRGRGLSTHRLLGKVSYLVAPAVLVTSVLVAHLRFAAMPPDVLAVDAVNLYLPLSAAVLFAPAWGGGILWRRSQAAHARFMVCTAFPLIDPIAGRILGVYLPPFPDPLLYQAITFGVGDLVLAWLAVRDRDSRANWVLRAMLAWTVVVHAGWFTLAPSDAWRAFARWFVTLPLT
jgi:uncharacterized membrane protein